MVICPKVPYGASLRVFFGSAGCTSSCSSLKPVPISIWTQGRVCNGTGKKATTEWRRLEKSRVGSTRIVKRNMNMRFHSLCDDLH